VPARFTLEMRCRASRCIDADLNACVIQEAEARRRREAIAQERILWRLDGASKFVGAATRWRRHHPVRYIWGGLIRRHGRTQLAGDESLGLYTSADDRRRAVSRAGVLSVAGAAGYDRARTSSREPCDEIWAVLAKAAGADRAAAFSDVEWRITRLAPSRPVAAGARCATGVVLRRITIALCGGGATSIRRRRKKESCKGREAARRGHYGAGSLGMAWCCWWDAGQGWRPCSNRSISIRRRSRGTGLDSSAIRIRYNITSATTTS